MDARPVIVLATGGTIASTGERAAPALDADALLAAIPGLAGQPDLRAETVMSVPSAQLTLTQALALARRATEEADAGSGVVLTTGTDTLEEVAVLCALLHGGQGGPVVLTGANRPASHPGADGPANLCDAIRLAAWPEAGELGVTVVFGGEIHDAMTVAKVDSSGPTAFGSPQSGPIGRVVEGRVLLHAHPRRPPSLVPRALEQRVAIVTAALGDDGTVLHRAAEEADGLVVVALGAGHLPPPMLAGLRDVARRLPVLICCRTLRASMLRSTYGFTGAEGDVRATGAIATAALSAPAARIALLCCLGAGLDRDAIARTLAPYDA